MTQILASDNKTSFPKPGLALIGAAIGCGAPDERCADAPLALRDGGLAEALSAAGLHATWEAVHLAPLRRDGADPLATVGDLARRMAVDTAALTRARRRFVAFGGDHTAAIGIWSGAARGLQTAGVNDEPPGRFGLIWVDAHMDSHTFATTESRMIHGMPVACLLGQGDPSLTDLAGTQPAVAPENLCLIGTRSFEPGEAALLARLGVRIIPIDEVQRIGFAAALTEARAIASNGTAGYGLSLDIDAFDPAEAPGTGYLEPNGLHADDVAPALRALAADARFVGLEIAEYNPHKDGDGRTARMIERLVKAAAGA
jgi:arginase